MDLAICLLPRGAKGKKMKTKKHRNPMKNVLGLRAFCIWLLAMQLATPNANSQPQTQSAKSSSDGPILDASKILPNNKDGIVVPSCQYMPEAPYTKEARKAKYQGIFVAEAIIELDGKLSNVRVVKSPGLGLDKPVLETLKKWKCTPAIGPSGKPVRTRIPIEISFRLGS